MSEENNDLGGMAEDAMDSAKDGAENLGDKASDALDSAKEAASETFEDAKEAASEFTDDVKDAAKDFQEDAKNAFDPSNPDSGKTIAIIAHITFIGWIIAIIMNGSNKTEIGSFYIRQTLGIWLFMIVLGFVPIVGCFAGLIGLVFIIISLVAAINGKMTPTVGVGHLFQDWFKTL
jgi:hypothetical protein